MYMYMSLCIYEADWIRSCRSISNVLREQSACAHSCYGVNHAYICQEQQKNAARVHPNIRRKRLRGEEDGGYYVAPSKQSTTTRITLNIYESDFLV